MEDTQVLSLSGVWRIVQDADRTGLDKGWHRAVPETTDTISVPGMLPQNTNYESHPYGNVYPGYHGFVWYYRTFAAPFTPDDASRFLLEFDNAGYLCRVYLNGRYVGEHRNHEEQFSFDVTDHLNLQGENLLAVHCFEPKIRGEAIEGISLLEIPNASRAYGDYDNDTCGGIMEDVRIKKVPDLRISSLYVRPCYETGDVTLEVTVCNSRAAAAQAKMTVSLFEHKAGHHVYDVALEVDAPVGESVHQIKAHIASHRLWDLKTPFLYVAEVSLCTGSRTMKRFGFKDFRVKNGFFFLNGRRIFLKSAHCAPTCEVALGMKTMGFNTIRMLTRRADQELMDICDEIGLLMIDSPLTAWGMFDHELTRQQVTEYTENIVLRDRSHACLAGYYLFNELMAGDGVKRKDHGYASYEVFRSGVEYLPRLRELDPDHLVLLSSGRWDCEPTIGSFSNPGSLVWEYGWGAEGPDAGKPNEDPKIWAQHIPMGDVHPYITFPVSDETRDWYRTLGSGMGPVFVSEEGWGSQSDPTRRYLELEAAGPVKDSIYSRQYKRLWQGLESFITDNGFTGIYPFAQDCLTEGYYLNGRQRQVMFDLLRSNPMICGYSLTSWCNANEGTLEGDNILKPGQAYALQEGWAPLRWALFTSDRTVYADQPFEIEAVLCNEDSLKPGSYRAIARLKGPQGIAWEKTFDAVYPAEGPGGMPPLAATVLKETVTLPAGDYTFAVRLLEGGAPFGGTLQVKVVSPVSQSVPAQPVAVCALEEKTLHFLRCHGVATVAVEKADSPALVLVGNLSSDSPLWETLDALAKAGSSVLFLRTAPFEGERNTPIPRLTAIAGEMARCTFFRNWLYHVDHVHPEHPLFYNMTSAGICDMETYGKMYPKMLLLDVNKPDAVACASIGLNCFNENNCILSKTLCEYNKEQGKYVLNTFQIEESLGEHPFADQLLLNLVSVYGK